MMRIFSLFLVGAFMVGGLLSLHGQSNAGGLSLDGFLKPNGRIILRWTPGDYDTWRLGMENGYRVSISMLDTLGETTFSYLVPDTIYPVPPGSWNNPDDEEYVELAEALCYDFSQSVYEGPQGAYTETEDRTNRFNFALLTADLSPRAANQMGFAYRHQDTEPESVYEYRVFLVDTDIESNTFRVDMNQPEVLPAPSNVTITFGKEEFFLSWDKEPLQQHYTSYTIEYSEDGGQSFQAMNEKPFVYFENEDIPADLQSSIVYRNTISADVPEYQFRVKGHNPYGVTGPASEVVSGRSVPDPLLVFPRITDVLEMADTTFKITWAINDSIVDSLLGFNVLRFEEFPGTPDTLNAELLTNDVRVFIDPNPNELNYYMLHSVDNNNYSYTSATALGKLSDSIPPAMPVDLVGAIDTLSDSTMLVTLNWAPNTEQDLAGYLVYRGNAVVSEFTHLTAAASHADTIYQDTILSEVLADFVYYKIRAVDFRGNLSPTTAAIEIQRPDMIAPSPPVLGLQAGEDGLQWANSSSQDVVSYRIESRPYGADSEWTAINTVPKSNVLFDRIEKSTLESRNSPYVYRVVAIDDAGLESVSNEVIIAPSPLEKTITGKISFNLATNVVNQGVELQFTRPAHLDIDKFIIFRSVNEGPFIQFDQKESTDMPSATATNGAIRVSSVDLFTEPGFTYRYRVQAKYANGEYSNISLTSTLVR